MDTFTAKEVASFLRVTPKYIRRLTIQRRLRPLPRKTKNERYRYTQETIVNYLMHLQKLNNTLDK